MAYSAEFVFLVACCMQSQEASELETAIARIHGHSIALHSIEFTSRTQFTLSDEKVRRKKAVKSEFSETLRFHWQNGSFRSETKIMDRRTGHPMEKYSLFDGDRFQVFEPSHRTLSVSKTPRLTNLSVGLNPILLPYLYLFDDGTPISIDGLKNPQLWERLKKRATWRGMTTKGDHSYAAVDIVSGFSPDHVIGLLLDPSLDYFPREYSLHTSTGQLLSHTLTTETQPFEFDGAAGLIPIRIKSLEYDGSGSVSEQFDVAIDVASLRVNEPIDQELFTIPVTQVNRLIDIDQKSDRVLRGGTAVVRGGDRLKYPIILGTILLAILASVMTLRWLWQRSSRR